MKNNLVAALVLGGCVIAASFILSRSVERLAEATEKKKLVDIGLQHTGYQTIDINGLKLNVNGRLRIEEDKK